MNVKKRSRVPHTYALLFLMIIMAVAMTYFVPAGSYDRVKDPNTGRTVVDPESFHYVEQTPVHPFGAFEAVHEGMVKAGDIVFFIFIIGGAFTIIRKTGVMDAGIHKVFVKFGNRQNLILILIMFLFSILGGTIGMAEEVIVFIPPAVLLCRQFGLDEMVGLAVTMIGARVGFTTGLMNPFTVGVAQGISELPLYSGLGYRIIWYVVIFVITTAYILRYAKKIKVDPLQSIMADYDEGGREVIAQEFPEFTKVHSVILAWILVCFGAMFWGIFKQGWYMRELAALFLLMGIGAGVLGRMGMNEISRAFVEGTKDLAFAALVCGVARAILVVLEQGQIVDTIIHGSASMLVGLPTMVAANMMYVFQLLLNFLIPSGSGQAMTTMPIMAPLADVLGITRQTAVLAFHYGDGFTNLVAPTLGSLMAALAVANVPFDRYLKWVMPLLFLWIGVGLLSVSIATVIRLGPF